MKLWGRVVWIGGKEEMWGLGYDRSSRNKDGWEMERAQLRRLGSVVGRKGNERDEVLSRLVMQEVMGNRNNMVEGAAFHKVLPKLNSHSII